MGTVSEDYNGVRGSAGAAQHCRHFGTADDRLLSCAAEERPLHAAQVHCFYGSTLLASSALTPIVTESGSPPGPTRAAP